MRDIHNSERAKPSRKPKYQRLRVLNLKRKAEAREDRAPHGGAPRSHS